MSLFLDALGRKKAAAQAHDAALPSEQAAESPLQGLQLEPEYTSSSEAVSQSAAAVARSVAGETNTTTDSEATVPATPGLAAESAASDSAVGSAGDSAADEGTDSTDSANASQPSASHASGSNSSNSQQSDFDDATFIELIEPTFTSEAGGVGGATGTQAAAHSGSGRAGSSFNLLGRAFFVLVGCAFLTLLVSVYWLMTISDEYTSAELGDLQLGLQQQRIPARVDPVVVTGAMADSRLAAAQPQNFPLREHSSGALQTNEELAEVKAQLDRQAMLITQLRGENELLRQQTENTVSAATAIVAPAVSNSAASSSSTTSVPPVDKSAVPAKSAAVVAAAMPSASSAAVVTSNGNTAEVNTTQSNASAVQQIEKPSALSHTGAAIDFRIVLDNAYKAWVAGDIGAAQRHYNRALALEPFDRDANLGVAAVAQQLGDYPLAEARYRHLLSVDPRDSAAFTGLLNLAAVSTNRGIARELDLHAQRTNGAGRLYAALGNAYSGAGNWPAARDAWQHSLSRDASNPDYAYNLAVSLDNLGQHSQAIDYYQRAIKNVADRTYHFQKPATIARLNSLLASR